MIGVIQDATFFFDDDHDLEAVALRIPSVKKIEAASGRVSESFSASLRNRRWTKLSAG